MRVHRLDRSETESAAARARSGSDGFALMETIVVVALIGILTAVFVPSYIGLRNGVRDSATRSDLAADRSAIVSWSVDNGGLVPKESGFDPGPAGSNLAAYGWSRSDETRALAGGDYSTDVAARPTRFCLQMTSTTGTTFRVSSNHAVDKGTCTDFVRATYCPLLLIHRGALARSALKCTSSAERGIGRGLMLLRPWSASANTGSASSRSRVGGSPCAGGVSSGRGGGVPR